jgi:hypothetical protein
MTRALLIAATLATGCAGGAYSMGYNAGYGATMAPATTSAGASTSIRYREYGGPIGKLILLLGTAPTPPGGTTSNVHTSTTCYSTYCEETTTYTYTPPSEEEMKDFEKRSADWSANVAPAILSGAIAMEVIIDYASTDLGGDTSGGGFYMNERWQIRSLGFFQGMSLSVGFGVAGYTMHGRTRDVLMDTGTALVLTPVTEDISYFYLGSPVRLTGLITPRLGLYGQMDLNWQPLLAAALDEREQPQIMRGGVQLWLPFFYVSGEAAVDGFRPDSLSITAEVGLAF